MIDVRRMLAWSDEMHAEWKKGLLAMAPDMLAAEVNASFLTPVGILTHMANVENAWIDVVEGAAPQWARHSTKKWTTLEPVLAYVEETRARTHRVVDGLADKDLERPCAVPGPFKKPAYTIEEILFTIVTHECFHRGELLAVFWQKDVTPPVCDYPQYATPLK
ncbi:MAG TPA: DinB family protein [Candidatus Thermoplasmatota archaeon]|nr:DinB family protein [Candidatus Thermoplasmatota archaeon]